MSDGHDKGKPLRVVITLGAGYVTLWLVLMYLLHWR